VGLTEGKRKSCGLTSNNGGLSVSWGGWHRNLTIGGMCT